MYDKYECDCCGACCKFAILEIESLDIVREPRLLTAIEPFRIPEGLTFVCDDDDEEEFRRLGPDVPEAPEGGSLNTGPDHGCPLLGTDNRCTIYPTRPTMCVAFRAGSRLCQDVREKAGLEPLKPILEDQP